jgi:hypothetical protein
MAKLEGIIVIIILGLILVIMLPTFALTLTGYSIYGSLLMIIAFVLAIYGFYKKSVKS